MPPCSLCCWQVSKTHVSIMHSDIDPEYHRDWSGSTALNSPVDHYFMAWPLLAWLLTSQQNARIYNVFRHRFRISKRLIRKHTTELTDQPLFHGMAPARFAADKSAHFRDNWRLDLLGPYESQFADGRIQEFISTLKHGSWDDSLPPPPERSDKIWEISIAVNYEFVWISRKLAWKLR